MVGKTFVIDNSARLLADLLRKEIDRRRRCCKVSEDTYRTLVLFSRLTLTFLKKPKETFASIGWTMGPNDIIWATLPSEALKAAVRIGITIDTASQACLWLKGIEGAAGSSLPPVFAEVELAPNGGYIIKQRGQSPCTGNHDQAMQVLTAAVRAAMVAS